ncbi:MAG: hypothetical protein ACM3XN_03275 [Chloroflexota bacterium]
MLAIDLIGLAITVAIAGPALLPHLFAAALLQETGRLIVAVAAGGSVGSIMAGGLFGRTSATGVPAELVLLAGPLSVLLAGVLASGKRGPRRPDLWLPWAATPRPFAAACCRLSILSLIQCLWALLVRGTIP